MTAIDQDLVRTLARQVSEALAARIQSEEATGSGLDRVRQQALGRHLLDEALDRLSRHRIAAGSAPLSGPEEDALDQAVLDMVFGLGPLERLLQDPTIENVFANGCDAVWLVRADGTKEPGPPLAGTDAELADLIRLAASRMGRSERRFDDGSPFLDLRLPDGSRLHAAMAVCDRPVLSVRRHRHGDVTLADLRTLGTLDRDLADFLAAAVRARCNIVVCGGTNAGKTTLLRALLAEADPSERLVVVEDSAELDLASAGTRHHDVVEFEARQANVEGAGEVTMAQLVREGLRMAPDRVIVGEIRGDEVLPMLLAMSQGNDGSLCTVHADSSAGAFGRIAMYAAMTAEQFRPEVTNLLIANSIDLVVHLARTADGRRVVSSVREVTDAEGVVVRSNEVYAPGQDGRAVVASPLRAPTLDRLRRAGFDDRARRAGATRGLAS